MKVWKFYKCLNSNVIINQLEGKCLFKNLSVVNNLELPINIKTNIRYYSKKYLKNKNLKISSNFLTKDPMVRILNVAEKNDAAKNLSEILSRGRYNRVEGFSLYNKVYEFEMVLQGQRVQMVMTSVSGHLLTHSFMGNYKKWYGCNPLDLFDAPLSKVCIENMEPIKRTLEREARLTNQLIIWTDCDREGENIGFEIISVCKAINPQIQVKRAIFSEITHQSVNRAVQNLGLPDKKQNEAVEVRSELDLRIGAAFTRFQTLRLQKVFPQVLAQTLISYGSCQFPTLGFVVERYKAIENFIPEDFWKIKVGHQTENCHVDFLWRRVRLFDQSACQILHDRCIENPVATVKGVRSKMKSKWRPLPLDTIEFEKLASRKLKLNAKTAMSVAEKLYTGGFISYPRTETNIFPKELQLQPLVQMQMEDPNWGEFATRVHGNGPTPRQGGKSDQAHPPIHPTKYTSNLQGNEKIVYEFIVRHFLACCDKDAKGTETIVEIDIAGEQFSASGLIILERNYLNVYPYDKWSDKEMPNYEQNQQFEPTSIDMVDGQTSPPPLLTEADLIALMEKHGIGTDATHAEHIEKIKSRLYVGLQDTRFVPGELGMGLVEGYDAMGFQMSKPNLRSELESDLKRICEGTKDPKVVLREQVDKYREVFREALRQASKIDEALAKFLNEAPQTPANEVAIPDVPDFNSAVMKCPSCGADVVLKSKRNNNGLYLSCQSYPSCRNTLWFPESVKKIEILDSRCPTCNGSPKKMKFTFSPYSYTPILPKEYISCVGGCDTLLLETLDIQPFRARQPPPPPVREQDARNGHEDSGYSTNSGGSFSSNSTPTRIITNNPTSRVPFTNLSSSGVLADNRIRAGNNESDNGFGDRQSQKHPGIFARPSTQSQRAVSNPGSSGFSNNNSNNTWFGGRENNAFPALGDTGNSANAIVCSCNEDAIKLTVKKDGPNKGRQFYKCSKMQGQGCNFFLWADDGNENSASASTSVFSSGNFNSSFNRSSENNSSSTFNSSAGWHNRDDASSFDEDKITCSCGTEARRLVTVKEGANKGREFYVCSKIREEQCGYFQWVDELGTSRGGGRMSGQSQSQRGTRGRGMNNSANGGGRKRKMSGTNNNNNNNNSNNASLKRKCGLCGGEGHDRRNCPNR